MIIFEFVIILCFLVGILICEVLGMDAVEVYLGAINKAYGRGMSRYTI